VHRAKGGGSISRWNMAGRRTLYFLLAVAIAVTGCKPVPKATRAEEQDSSTASTQSQQAPTLSPEQASRLHALAITQTARSPKTTTTEPNRAAAADGPAEPAKAPGQADPCDANLPVSSIASDSAESEPNALEGSFNSRFEPILGIYVNSEGQVDYAKLRRMRLLFAPLLQELDDLSPEEYDSWPHDEKIAFWINTFNVCTLKVVADNYPIKGSVYKMLFYPSSSIMQIDGAWSDYKFKVMGVAYSLSEIEQRILLNRFNEPRVAFALSYASRWSPRLRNKPYYGVRLDQQLDAQTREFISSENGFRIDKGKTVVYLSIVFRDTRFPQGFVEKYGEDRRFNDERPEVRAMLSFISIYLDRADVDYLSGKKYDVTYMKPDWGLNE